MRFAHLAPNVNGASACAVCNKLLAKAARRRHTTGEFALAYAHLTIRANHRDSVAPRRTHH
jgi:hypothetical protein